MSKIKIPLVYAKAKYRAWRRSSRLAAVELAKLVEMMPGSSRLRYQLAEAQFKDRQFKKAIENVDYILKNDVAYNQEALITLKLKVLLKSERYDELEEISEAAVRGGASWYDLWRIRADAARKQENFVEAAKRYEEALARADTSGKKAYCLHILGYLYASGGSAKKADMYYKKALETTEDVLVKQLGVGRMHQKMGWHAEAAACYEALLRENPDEPEVYFQLGSVYKKLGERRKAEQSFVEYVKRERKRRGIKGSIDDKLVVFDAFFGKRYADSPKEIYRYMASSKKYKDFRFVWVLNGKSWRRYWRLYLNPRVKVVRRLTREYYLAYADAKYWVTNSRIPFVVKSHPEQIYVQCWHGTPLKKLAHSIATTTQIDNNLVKEQYDSETRQFDYLLSPSAAATKSFTEAFNLKGLGKEGAIVEEGYPRNDPLLRATEKDIQKIKKQLAIPVDKKVLLYAPTWRDDNIKLGRNSHDVEVDFDLLQEKLASDWVMLFRPHYLIAEAFDFGKYEGFVYDVASVEDVNDLYLVSDALITDYSSVFFDYANLHRPIVFYMYDLEHYRDNLRGFYLDLRDLPGDIVKTEGEIVNILNNLSAYNRKYRKKYTAFNATFNYLDDGHVAERIAQKVFSGRGANDI